MSTKWAPVEGYDNYEVSNTGFVANLKTGRTLRPRLIKTGYLIVDLSSGGKSKSFYLHKLVAEAHVPNPKELPYVLFLDLNKENADASNLKWATKGDVRDYTYVSKTSKKELEGNDIPFIAQPMTEGKLGFVWYEYQGSWHKVFYTGSTVGIRLKNDKGKWHWICIAEHVLNDTVGPRPSKKHIVGYRDWDHLNLNPLNLFWETYVERSKRYDEDHKVFAKLRKSRAKNIAKKAKENRLRKSGLTHAEMLEQGRGKFMDNVSEHRLNRVLKLRKNGKSLRFIAKDTGLTMYRVRTILSENAEKEQDGKSN